MSHFSHGRQCTACLALKYLSIALPAQNWCWWTFGLECADLQALAALAALAATVAAACYGSRTFHTSAWE